MKTIQILTAIILAAGFTGNAQVGIGTLNPQGAFHVDGANDNAPTGAPTVAQQANDFIVVASGHVGIGTTTPVAPLEIKSDASGAIKITDGTEQSGRVLTSDENGVGTWQAPSTGNKTVTWRLAGSRTYSTTAPTLVTRTGSFLGTNEMGATLGTNSLNLPAGKYLIFVNFDIAGGEYGIFQVYNGSTNIFTSFYGEWLNGSFLFQTASAATLTCQFQGRVGSQNPASGYYRSDYNNVQATSEFTILKLN